MKFNIKQSSIIDSIQKIQGPTFSKQNFPILNCILIEAFKNKVKMTTTDLDTTIIINNTKDVIIEEEGKIAIPAKRFISIIKELPKEEIFIESFKNNLLIKCGKIEFKVNGIDPHEFPVVEERKEKTLIKINPSDLLEMMKLTSFCVGFEDKSYVLNGIFFELYENTITLVSTDGKRLSVIKRKLPSSQQDLSGKISFIFSIKSVNELYKLIKDVKEEIYLFVDRNNIGVDLKEIIFISKPIEGEFPDYSQYIPQSKGNKLKVNRREFLAALRRAEILSIPDYRGVKLSLKKEELLIYKSTPQLGEVKESLPAAYDGAQLDLGFNPTYLIDVLKNLEEENISFNIYGVDKPAILKLEDYMYLVLPMKI